MTFQHVASITFQKLVCVPNKKTLSMADQDDPVHTSVCFVKRR